MIHNLPIHEKLNELIPYITENVISYPLWEEGKYIPFIRFWQKAETAKEIKQLNRKLKKIPSGYSFFVEPKEHRSVIHRICIFPDYEDTNDGGYKFVKEDWSIEEILEIIKSIINNTFYFK